MINDTVDVFCILSLPRATTSLDTVIEIPYVPTYLSKNSFIQKLVVVVIPVSLTLFFAFHLMLTMVNKNYGTMGQMVGKYDSQSYCEPLYWGDFIKQPTNAYSSLFFNFMCAIVLCLDEPAKPLLKYVGAWDFRLLNALY